MTETTPQGVSSMTVDEAAQALEARYEAQAAEPSTEAEAEQVEAEPTEEISAEQPEEVEGEPEAEAEPTEKEDAQDEQAEARFETLSELAEATGMEPEEFLKSIKANVKVQGEQSEVNLADLIKGYQLESDYTRKNETFLNDKKEWEASREAEKTKLTAELEKAGYAFAMAQQELTRDYNAIDWNQLQKDNPQDYLIKRQQFGERQAGLDNAINQATQNAQAIADQQKQEGDVKAQEHKQAEYDLLMSAIPEWQDAKTFQAEGGKVHEFLFNNGFSSEDIQSLSDHRIYLLARQAMNGVKAAKDVDLVKKKVVKAPKLVKPNARQNVNPNQQNVTRLRKQLKKSGSVNDLAELLKARG